MRIVRDFSVNCISEALLHVASVMVPTIEYTLASEKRAGGAAAGAGLESGFDDSAFAAAAAGGGGGGVDGFIASEAFLAAGGVVDADADGAGGVLDA
ncbi:MAG TPA: hypothetical protein VHS08_02045, partial [Candidatus Acidoferrales bacterium]|nr:hypothetical protein [Candidatus Acidoferrales bacterium]